MDTNSIRFGFIFMLTMLAASSARALTFGELADQAAEQRDYQHTGQVPPQETPDYNSRRSISRYSCPAPSGIDSDIPQYNPVPGRYGRDDSMPVPRYDPYFDPSLSRPYYGYDDNFSDPGWSRRQAEKWWSRRRR